MRAKKKLSQNFLNDAGILSQILDNINPKEQQLLLEIGCGTGILTCELLQKAKVVGVELDKDLIPILLPLKQHGLTLLHQDVLQLDFKQLVQEQQHNSLMVVGNLPYQISSLILFKCLDAYKVVDGMCFMLQKELAIRLVAPPSDNKRGRITAMLEAFFDIEYKFTVPNTAFNPIPKVDSAIITFKKRSLPLVSEEQFAQYSTTCRLLFINKRKTIKKILSINSAVFKHDAQHVISTELLTLRPADLSSEQILQISQFLQKTD